nr:unnamed protein product [Callosobruchus chinensis]
MVSTKNGNSQTVWGASMGSIFQ